MNLRRLKYFVKIVDIGSLTQAAEVLHIAQPALSQQVATLEGELNQKLLHRTKRGVTPTEAGKLLYVHACIILRQCEQAQTAVTHMGQQLKGNVAIGLTPGTTASALTMPLLQSIREQFPEMQVYLHESDSRTLNKKLRDGELDIAVLYERAPVPGVASLTLLKEDLFLVGTRACPGSVIELAAVARMALLLPRHYGAVCKRLDEVFASRHLNMNVIGEIESAATLMAAVASGLGVTVLPESAARTLAGSITRAWIAQIASPALSLPLSLNVSAHAALSPPAQAVKNILLALLNTPDVVERKLSLVG